MEGIATDAPAERTFLRAHARELVTLAAVVMAFAYFRGPVDWGGTTQLALTKSIARGTPQIDRARLESPDPRWGVTGDIGAWKGHIYSDKAPGLAFASVPAYAALRAVGVRATGNPRRLVWLLALWAAVLPATALLLLVRREANTLEAGTGTATALVLGLGTLLFGSAEALTSQSFSALLCFAAFLLLLAARTRADGRLVLAGGLVAGYAVTTEYPNALAVLILGGLVAAGPDRLRRLGLYAAGVCLGVIPLLLYDRWAFGSFFRYSRSKELLTTEHNRVQKGIGGVGAPSLHGLREILFDHRLGLLVQSPVLVLAGAGLVLLYRRGHRAEALVCGAMTAAYLTYLSGFLDPFGGRSSGPRYLVTVLPFLALGLAPVFRRIPRVTLAVGLVSIGIISFLHVTNGSLLRVDPSVSPLTRFRREEFVPAALNPIGHQHPLANVFPWFVVMAVLVALLVSDPGLRRKAVD